MRAYAIDTGSNLNIVEMFKHFEPIILIMMASIRQLKNGPVYEVIK